MLTLSIEKRDSVRNLTVGRKMGKVPAILYGRKEKSTSIWVTKTDFIKVWRKAGETSVIELKGGEHEMQALIQEIDTDPVSDSIRHIDFYVIEKDKKLEVSIPIHFVGISPAVKDLGGILVKVSHELKIEALPKDLPHSFEIDISALIDFESQILAKDITMPAGVALKEKLEAVIAAVDKPREEKEEEAVPVDLSAIEVEKKGKEPIEREEVTSTTGKTPSATTGGKKEGSAPAGKK